MCNEVITKYPQCGHQDTDTFPCDPLLDTGSCPRPASSPKIIDREDTLCHDCAETQHLEAALRQIEQDDSLAPVPTATHKDPSAPKHYLQTREWFPTCGHGARYQWTDFEADPRHLYIDHEIPFLSCYGCELARPGAIEAVKARGMWDGNEDPWGEKGKVSGGAGGSGTAASAPIPAPAPARDPTPSRQDVPGCPPSGIAAATFGPVRPVRPAPADDNDDLYADPPQETFPHDESGLEDEGGKYDTSAAKNKGIRGRSEPERHPSRRGAERSSSPLDERARFSPSPSSSDEADGAGWDSDYDRKHRGNGPVPAPLRARRPQRAEEDDGDLSARLPGDGEGAAPPDFHSRTPSPSATPGAGNVDPNATAIVGEEEHARLGMGALRLSNVQFLSFKRRKAREGREAMTQFKSGVLDGIEGG